MVNNRYTVVTEDEARYKAAYIASIAASVLLVLAFLLQLVFFVGPLWIRDGSTATAGLWYGCENLKIASSCERDLGLAFAFDLVYEIGRPNNFKFCYYLYSFAK